MKRGGFVNMRMRRFSFRPRVVMNAVDRARRRNLTRLGGWIRKTARRSILKRKSTSAPGKPPSSHVGRLKNLIFYAFDEAQFSVVIGAMLWGGAKFRGSRRAPELLEHGGVTSRSRRGRRPRRMRYRPRPFMGPALGKAVSEDKLAQVWRNSVRR